MSYARPTFHESWYRIAELRPSLHPMTQIVRQTFRSRRWYVLHDPIADAYHRMSAPAYRFVGLLDSKRSVGEAWQICVDRDGDEAPTQGEAIRVLGQLAAANLLRGDLPADAGAIMRRSNKRTSTERVARAHSFLFVRMSLWDPDRWLDRWTPLAALVWSRAALVPLCLLMLVVVWFVLPRGGRITAETMSVLETNNLLLLYAAFVIAKLTHEFAHATSCKALLHKEGLRGGVHQIGVMLLVMIPMPYVDASSATALPMRAHRIVVAAAGMMAELTLAGCAAIIWAVTPEHAALHIFCFNLMFIGSISTLLFNINPLLRYDGYYILSDMLGVANLAQRSREMIMHLVKRHAWGVRSSNPPTSSRYESSLLAFYGVASAVYRVAVLVGIIFFVAQQLFVVGVAMAIAAGGVWLVWPLCRFITYLATSPDLMNRRHRALFTTVAALAVIAGLVGGVRFPHAITLFTMVEPSRWTAVRAQEDGVVTQFAGRGVMTESDALLVELSSVDIDASYDSLRARAVQARYQAALADTVSPAAAAMADDRLAVITSAIESVIQQRDNLVVRAPYPGAWEPDETVLMLGAHLQRGQIIGTYATDERLVLVSLTNQDAVAHLMAGDMNTAECRSVTAPDRVFHASLDTVARAAETGTNQQTQEPGFVLRFNLNEQTNLRAGQTVLVRVNLPPRSLLARARDWYANSIGSELNI